MWIQHFLLVNINIILKQVGERMPVFKNLSSSFLSLLLGWLIFTIFNYVYASRKAHVCLGAIRDHRYRSLLELKSQAVVNCDMGAGILTQVLRKTNTVLLAPL